MSDWKESAADFMRFLREEAPEMYEEYKEEYRQEFLDAYKYIFKESIEQPFNNTKLKAARYLLEHNRGTLEEISNILEISEAEIQDYVNNN